VNALTYTARLHQHNAGVRPINERTNLSRKEGDRLLQVVVLWLVTRAVLVGAVTAIGTIFLDWDAEKAQGVATHLGDRVLVGGRAVAQAVGMGLRFGWGRLENDRL
jgi:hypothetical protein